MTAGDAVAMDVQGTLDIIDNDILNVVPSVDFEFSSNNTCGIISGSSSALRIAGNYVVGWRQGVFCGGVTDLAYDNHVSGFSVAVWNCGPGTNRIVE